MYESLHVCISFHYMASMTEDRTSIACKRDTLEQMQSLKRGGQTFDELLNQLMQSFDREV